MNFEDLRSQSAKVGNQRTTGKGKSRHESWQIHIQTRSHLDAVAERTSDTFGFTRCSYRLAVAPHDKVNSKHKVQTQIHMFTGIIEELGHVRLIEERGENARILISASVVTVGTNHGDSIAVNGVCLTALDISEDSFAADVSRETLQRSTLGRLKQGAPVNLERAVTPTTRLGGHIVQGHVDGRGKLLGVESLGESWTLRIAYSEELGRYLVFKGSVSVEGISLTIANLTAEYFEIAIIPKTWEMTNLSSLTPGDDVNLEVDVIGKYVERLLSSQHPPG